MLKHLISCFVLVLAGAGVASSATVYQNTDTDTFVTYFHSVGPYSEIGDAITLGGTERLLNSAAVQFYNDGSAGTFDAELRFWETGGPVGAQIGGAFLMSGISIGAQGIETVTFSDLNLLVLDNIIFTVGLLNVGSGVDVGLNAFEPPSIGSSLNDSLIIRIGSDPFAAVGTAAGEGNLYFQLEAGVPEPSTFVMAGGALLIGILVSRRKR
jgi:hypothetical protein